MHKYKIFTYLKYFILLGLFFFSLSAVGFSSWNLYDAFGIDSISFAEPVCYNNKTNVQYYTIEDALSNASSGDTIFTYVGKNPTIRKSCTIKVGVTLCLPFDDSGVWNGRQSGDDSTKWFDDGGNIFADANASRVNTYRKNSVTISKNVKLTNKGSIQIGGVLGCENTKLAGHTSGNYCEFVLDENASIVSDGTIYCLGYIKEKEYDNGSKFIINSGTVYAPFVIYDYRGGSSTAGSYQNGGITPFNVYDMPNIKPYSRYSYDSNLIGYADLHTGAVSSIIKAQHNTTDIKIIGKSASVITLTSSNSYVEAKSRAINPLYTTDSNYSDYTELNIYGGAESGVMELSVKILSKTVNVSTQDCFFPISYRYKISMFNGSFNLVNPLKLMNGSYFYVASDASLNVSSEFIIYPSDFVDEPYANIAYPTLPAPDFVVDGDVRFSGSIGGFTQTYSRKVDYAYLYEDTANTTVTSTEGYATRSGLSFTFTSTETITEQATAMVLENGAVAETNLEQTIYVSESNTSYFIKADNLGSYTINYHLNGGTVDGETITDDVITRSYPIVKGVTLTLNSFSINNPVKRFYLFDSWRLVSEDGSSAIGSVVNDGTILDVYARYNVATYNIFYDVQYSDDIEPSESFVNNNLTSFTKDDLPLILSKPIDGELFFYGWYYNNDTSKEITQITTDLDGVGYGDIEFSGYFSTKIMSSVSFDANGHSDYFENLESYNIVTSSPSEVVLPTSSKDSNYSSLYYLKGWTYVKDDANTIFDPSLDSFNSQNVTLYALWGNKIKVNYYFNYYGSTNNSPLDTIYCYPGQKVQIRNLDGVSEYREVHAPDDSYYDVFGASKWQIENSPTYYNPDSIQTIDGSEGQSYNLYPLFDNAKSRYYKIKIHNKARYHESRTDPLSLFYSLDKTKYIECNNATFTKSGWFSQVTLVSEGLTEIYAKSGESLYFKISASYDTWVDKYNSTLSYPGGSSSGTGERFADFVVSSACDVTLSN